MNTTIKRWLILTVLVILVYFPTFIWMNGRFLWADSYYSHGYLIPVIVLALVWMKREQLKSLEDKPKKAGLLILLLALLIHLLFFSIRIYFVSGFTLIVTFAALLIAMHGYQHVRKLWFCLFFLVFMVPLPLLWTIGISFKMKMFVAYVSNVIVNVLGVDSIKNGSKIILSNTVLTVGSPCSGLRSLISLAALGSIYAYLMKFSTLKKWIMFIVSMPLAVVSNIIRVVILIVIANFYGSEAATGTVHDILGYLVFVFAFLGLKLTEMILRWTDKKITS